MGTALGCFLSARQANQRRRPCDHRGALRPQLSASTISAINKRLDEALTKFARRRLTDDYPYLILDARYVSVEF